MSVNATLDQGNSCTKLVLFDSATGAEVACATLKSADEVRQAVGGHDVSAAIGCTVSSGNIPELLAATGAPSTSLFSSTDPAPLANGYANPAALGADRLAAAVGAAALHPGEDLLVADIGTAVTYDLVSADGRFLGGNIAPGPGMRLRALNHYTAQLPLVSGHAPVPAYGTDTHGAMRAGALRGVVAELLMYASDGRRLILSGGWAPEIAALLPQGTQYEIHPHLVNLGLNKILNQK